MNYRGNYLKNIFSSILLVFLIQGGLYAAGKERYRIVVFELQSGTVQNIMLRIARNKLEFGLLKQPVFQVVTRDEQQRILQEHNIYRACKNTLCVQEFGKLFASNLNITGSIEFSDNTYFFSVKVVKTENAEVLLSYTVEFSDKQDVADKALEIISKLTKEIHAAYNKKYLFSHYSLNAQFLYLYPISSLHKIVKNGYGGMVQFNLHDFYLNSFGQISAGFLYYEGKENSNDYAFFIPLYVAAGYRFVIKPVEVSPLVGVGGAVMTFSHESGDQGFFNEHKTRSSVNFLWMFGATVSYNIKGYKIFCSLADYMVYEKSGVLNAVSGSLGISMIF